MEAIQNYQAVEQQHRQKYKQRLERQYKIVKPDATPEEIRAVVEDDNSGQVFSQAVRIYPCSYPCTHSGRLIVIVLIRFLQLMNSNRYGESKAAYREVQERHKDIQKIERTLAELAQLFNDVRGWFLG